MFDAVVLAGTGKESDLTRLENISNKAFILLNGRPLLAFVLDALRATPEVGRIAVVGPPENLAQFAWKETILSVPEAGSIPENILAGYLALRPRRHFLIVSSDIPLLSAASLDDFLVQSRPYLSDFYYPIIRREDTERRFPGAVRTYARLREGVFTGGNVFLLNPAKVEEVMTQLRRFVALRKSPARLAGELGVSFIVKFLTRRLSVAELESRLPDLLGLSGKAVFSRFAEIGTDVDKPSDLDLVRREQQSFTR